MVLTHIAWAAITISLNKGYSYDLRLRTWHCSSTLRLFKIGTEIPPTCKDYTFYNINPYSVLKVPSGCTDAYKKATGWKKFASITGLDE